MNDQQHKDPNNYKWGLFYFNPEDKRLFVPKRIQAWGITLNFAHPLSMAVIAAFIIFVGLMS